MSFMENGWSTKKLIRKVMLSKTYRMSSQGTPGAIEADHARPMRREELFMTAGAVGWARQSGRREASMSDLIALPGASGPGGR